MTVVVPAFYPAGDLSFREAAQHVLEGREWDFDSDEGVALLQAVLQTSYPMAAVVADRSSESGWAGRTFLDFHRDGTPVLATATLAWLSAVYDLAAQPAYQVTLRLLGDTGRAEAVVEVAFAELVRDRQVPMVTAAHSVYATAVRLARNQLRAERGLAPLEEKTSGRSRSSRVWM